MSNLPNGLTRYDLDHIYGGVDPEDQSCKNCCRSYCCEKCEDYEDYELDEHWCEDWEESDE